LIAVEKGDRPVKPDELIRLAEMYGRSVHELVRPGVPAMSIEPHLRAVVKAESPKADVSEQDANSGYGPELEQAIADLQRFAEDYKQLEDSLKLARGESYPPEVQIPARGVATFADSVATAERARLGLGDQPLLHVRDVLENQVGLRILYTDKLPSTVAGMYAYAAEVGYCIAVNRKHPPERRRATVAHEYGHFLSERHKPGIDYLSWQGRKPPGERFAEAFGMSFLMPSSGIQRMFFETVAARRDFQVADLVRLAHCYGTSVQATTLRLESLSLVPKGTWDDLNQEGFRVRTAQRELGLSATNGKREAPYSDRYKFLAVLAHEEGIISEGELANFFRTDRITARRIAAECLKDETMEDSGETTQCEFRFAHSLLHAQDKQ
jgi:Zn-dependent peptidase ImmA (M78 family)